MNDLSQLDPAWAWKPFQPDNERPWDRRAVAHLFRRAGIAANWEQLEEHRRLDPQEAVAQLVNGGKQDDSFLEDARRLADTLVARDDPRELSAWWIYRLLNSPDQLGEKMCLFWHGHFATSAAKVLDPRLMLSQNRLFREHALGDFGELAQAISKDPAMLIYLDSATNRKAHPNENFARELMELFCLGEGNYSERDIRELAKCFTGWEIRRKQFRFNRYQHDFGDKDVLGHRGKLTGEQAVQYVVDHAAAPYFIARKLIRYFVMDEPTPSDELVEPLAKQFRKDGLQIKPLVQKILASQLFFDPRVRGRKVRTPIEASVGFLRALNGSTNLASLSATLTQMDQALFYPPDVKGWDGGRAWINSATLLDRANLIRNILTNKKTRFAKTSLVKMLEPHVSSPKQLVAWLDELMFSRPLGPDLREQITSSVAGKPLETAASDLVYLMCTMPEYQLG